MKRAKEGAVRIVDSRAFAEGPAVAALSVYPWMMLVGILAVEAPSVIFGSTECDWARTSVGHQLEQRKRNLDPLPIVDQQSVIQRRCLSGT